MKRNVNRLWLIVSLLAILFFACSKSSNNGSNGPSYPNSGTGKMTINIINFSFSPATVTIPKGTTVTWTNKDVTAHTVTANDNSYDSGALNPGATYSFTFNQTGTINYHCSIHPFMTASIVVQ